MFELSPMILLSRADLATLKMKKWKYVDQLASAFHENLHKIDFLDAFEQRIAASRSANQMMMEDDHTCNGKPTPS